MLVPAMSSSPPRPSSPETHYFVGAAAIAVGHEVEFVTYKKTNRLLLMSHSITYEVLTDLGTGVVYTPWVDDGETPAWEEKDVVVESRVRGRVVQCRVQTMTHGDGLTRTRLLLDVSR